MLKPRIVIADDHALMIDGLRRLLEPEFEVVGTATNGRELLTLLDSVAAEVVVLDIAMPELNGVEAARIISKTRSHIRIVFVTQQIDRHYVQAAFQAGAAAFVAKQSASSELQTAIRNVMRGEPYITPLVKMGEYSLSARPGGRSIFGGELTSRQREVLQLIAEGRTVKEIGAALKISPKTVEFHKAAIMDQLGMRTTADLTRYALTHGIVSNSPAIGAG